MSDYTFHNLMVSPLPCPFCGNPGEIRETHHNHFVVQCTNEDCLIHRQPKLSPMAAIAVWNERANETLLPCADKTSLALEAVLLFHSGSPWDRAKRLRWDHICGELVPAKFNDYGLYDRTHSYDATTRMLCDLVRVALESAAPHAATTKGK